MHACMHACMDSYIHAYILDICTYIFLQVNKQIYGFLYVCIGIDVAKRLPKTEGASKQRLLEFTPSWASKSQSQDVDPYIAVSGALD